MAGLTLDWQQDGQQATIRQGGALVNGARLIGVPFLIAGGYLLYQFGGGLVNGELTVAGWIVLPLLGIAVALPGWCLLLWRRRIRLDNARREVIEEIDFILFKRRKAVAITNDSCIRLRYEEGSTSTTKGAVATHSRTRYDIHVDAVVPGKPDTLIALFAEAQKPEALALAARAGAFLGVAVKDRMVEGGDVTSGGVVVDALDPEEAD